MANFSLTSSTLAICAGITAFLVAVQLQNIPLQLISALIVTNFALHLLVDGLTVFLMRLKKAGHRRTNSGVSLR